MTCISVPDPFKGSSTYKIHGLSIDNMRYKPKKEEQEKSCLHALVPLTSTFHTFPEVPSGILGDRLLPKVLS